MSKNCFTLLFGTIFLKMLKHVNNTSKKATQAHTCPKKEDKNNRTIKRKAVTAHGKL